MRIGCFCKHDVALQTVRALLAAGHSPVFVIVQERYRSGGWFGELETLCAEQRVPFLSVERIKEAQNIDYIRAAAPDLIVSVMYTEIISQQIIDIPRYGIINHHPSLLPAYRGPHPVNWAIINGETRTGLTVHFMNAGVDAGDIILQREVPIGLDDTITNVSQRIMALVPQAALECVRQIGNGSVRSWAQDESRASYFPRRTEQDDIVDWKCSAKQVHDLIRGLYYPLPGALSWLKGRRVVLRQSSMVRAPGDDTRAPGTIIAMTEGTLTVQTGTGPLLIDRIDLDDRQNLAAGSTALGSFAKIGDCFSHE